MNSSHHSRTFLEKILQGSSTALIGLNETGKILYADSRVCHLFGIEDSGDLTGLLLSSLVDREHREQLDAFFSSESNSSTDRENIFHLTIPGINGESKPVFLKLIHGQESSEVSFTGEFLDLTDPGSLLARIRELDTHYRKLFENMRSGVAIYAVQPDELILL